MLNRTVLALTFLLLGAAAGAQQYYYKLNFDLSAKDFADTLAIDVKQGRVYVPVTIGNRAYRFMLDTGASMSGIYSDVHIDGTRTQGHITSHDANGLTYATPVVSLPPVRLGRLTLTNYHANVVSRPPTARGADGILGFDIFNKGIVGKIDTRHRRLILTDRKKLFDDEPGYEARYRLHNHVPCVTLSPFDGYEEPVRFDTGDRSFYALSRLSYDAALNGSPAEVQRQVEGRTHGSQRMSHYGAETSDVVTALCLDALRWGGHTFSSVRTLTTQGRSTIGARLLDYGTVIIHPKRRQLVFQPYDGSTLTVVDNRLPDIYYVPLHGMASVGLVWEDSEPYRQGFRQGDIILQINDTPIRSFRQFTAFPFIKGMTYTLTLRDKEGRDKQVRLTR